MSDHDPTYAAKLCGLLRRADKEARVFIDVGAHRGDFSLMLAEAFPGSRIFAVEADVDLCGVLESRLGTQVGADVTNVVLLETDAVVPFRVHADRGTSSVFARAGESRRYFHSSDRVVEARDVRSMSLDSFMAAKKIESVQLLKLDTQGAEAAILRGARDALARALIDIIYTEFFVVPHYESAALLPDLWRQLSAHGYQLYDLFKGPCGINGQLRFGDAIFVSPNFRRLHIDNFGSEP